MLESCCGGHTSLKNMFAVELFCPTGKITLVCPHQLHVAFIALSLLQEYACDHQDGSWVSDTMMPTMMICSFLMNK